MSAVPEDVQTQIPASVTPAPLLRAVLVCDLTDSAQLTQRLGDVEAAELAQRLDRIARDLVYRHHGREIDKSDGFLLLFERPVYAVAFALDYQRRLRELATAESLPLSAHIGIHVGDVVLWENTPADVARGAKPTEVEGLAKPVAARLM
ncbi:MAG TPA: putative peptide modification system cyclase, partial [Rudaea sp.]|nr:putative peptide modification system cyclase [Rudaea sp.]